MTRVRTAAPSALSALRFAVIVTLVALTATAAACAGGPGAPPDAVHVLTAAEGEDAAAVVVRLDTPGGLITSMNGIVKRILSSEVPIIVYVSPSGGQAASAGTFITMAAHVAA